MRGRALAGMPVLDASFSLDGCDLILLRPSDRGDINEVKEERMSVQLDSPILFDIPEGEPADIEFLEGLGHPVLICHGPATKTLCPILAGKDCPLLDAAHGIVFQFDLDRPQHRAILARYKEVTRDDVPIWVVVTPEQATQYTSLLAGLKVLTHDPVAGDLDGLAAEVEAADNT